jgi:hypothetical protein
MNGINFIFTSEVHSVAYYNVRLENGWKVCHKTDGNNKIIWFSAGKFHVFVTPYRYSSLLTEGQKSKSMVVLGRLQGKFFVPCLKAKPSHSICKRILPFLQSQTHTCIAAEIQFNSIYFIHGSLYMIWDKSRLIHDINII